ncbi:hypothetical protein D3C80_1440630 [compost metagenome]
MGNAWLDCAQWAGHRVRQHTARLHLPSEHVEEGRLGGLLLVAQQIRVKQWPMKRHETRVAADRQMQRGDVAVANERFGVITQQPEIDAIEQPGRAVTTAQADDRIDVIVGECAVQVIESYIIATGQVAVFLVDTGKHFQRVTPGAHPLHGFIGVQRRGTGGRNHANRAFRRQRRYGNVRTKGMGRSYGHP